MLWRAKGWYPTGRLWTWIEDGLCRSYAAVYTKLDRDALGPAIHTGVRHR